MSDTPKCPLCGSDLELFGSYLVCRGVLKCPLHEWLMPRHAIDVIAAKLAPQPVGDGVEVRAAVGMDKLGAVFVYGLFPLGDVAALSKLAECGYRHVAWLTARVPLPQVPTVAAKVEGVKADE